MWKQIKEMPGYEINISGAIKRTDTSRIKKVFSNNVRGTCDGKPISYNHYLLMKKYFPEKSASTMESEIWTGCYGYENDYRVSNTGKVMSVERAVIRSNGNKYYVKQRILKPTLRGKKGRKYLCVRLYKDGVQESLSVHRLVAIAFVPNPNNYPVVNHDDGNKLNNNATNLGWCTVLYNTEHANNVLKSRDWLKRKVLVKDLDGNILFTADSVLQAANQLGCHRAAIRHVCLGNYSHHKGYKFSYL